MSENVSDVLSEATDILNSVNEDHQTNKNIDNALEMMEDIYQSPDGIKTESVSVREFEILRKCVRSATGLDVRTFTGGLKTESAPDNFQNQMVFESVKQIIKDFWIALKSSFNSIWNKLKAWYLTVTSASEGLIKKANKLRTRAERISTTPKVRRIDYRNFKNVHIGGKIKSHELTSATKGFQKLMDVSLNVRTANETENFIDSAENALEEFVSSKSAGKPDSSWVNRFADLYTPSTHADIKELKDSEQKKIYGITADNEKNAIYKCTNVLPGNCLFVFSEVKETSTLEMADKVDMINARLIPADNKAHQEQSISIEVLPIPIIIEFCDSIVTFSEAISYYEKAWERRDKFMSKLIKTIDKTISRIDDEDLDIDVSKTYKRTCRSILRAVKRSNLYNASLINYSLRLSNGLYDLGNTCLSQYD